MFMLTSQSAVSFAVHVCTYLLLLIGIQILLFKINKYIQIQFFLNKNIIMLRKYIIIKIYI